MACPIYDQYLLIDIFFSLCLTLSRQFQSVPDTQSSFKKSTLNTGDYYDLNLGQQRNSIDLLNQPNTKCAIDSLSLQHIAVSPI